MISLNVYKHFIYKDTYLSNKNMQPFDTRLLDTDTYYYRHMDILNILLDQNCKNTKIQTVHFETCYSILMK